MKVPRAELFVCPMRTPRDTSALEALFDDGRVAPESVVALIGKSEGTGLADDPERATADEVLRDVMARRLRLSPERVEERVVTILSGGCAGILSPHVTVVAQEWAESAAPAREGLVSGRARSEPIAPEEIGRMSQIRKVAAAVRDALAGMGQPGDVHLVLVKAPTLSPDSVADADARGASVVTRDLSIGRDGAMCFSNDASALGVALALGEVPEDALADDVVRRDWSLYSSVAMTSSAVERTRADVVVLANAPSLSSARIAHGVLRDVIDAGGIREALRGAGLRSDEDPQDLERVVQVFMKLTVPGSDELRGARLTLPSEPLAPHLAKAIGGTLVASVIGRTTVFVSGGEQNSHQGPPDGNPVAAVVRHA